MINACRCLECKPGRSRLPQRLGVCEDNKERDRKGTVAMRKQFSWLIIQGFVGTVMNIRVLYKARNLLMN